MVNPESFWVKVATAFVPEHKDPGTMIPMETLVPDETVEGFYPVIL